VNVRGWRNDGGSWNSHRWLRKVNVRGGRGRSNRSTAQSILERVGIGYCVFRWWWWMIPIWSWWVIPTC